MLLVSQPVRDNYVHCTSQLSRLSNSNNDNYNKGNFFSAYLPHRVEAQGALQ